MQAAAEEPTPVGLVLDGEMREPSDLLALAVVYGLTSQQPAEAELEAIALTGSTLDGAAFVEAVGRFYNKIILRDYPERFQRYRGLPIGLDDTQGMPADVPALVAVLDRTGADGEPLYPHQVAALTDTADPAALIRNALTAKADGDAAVILNGPATNLARLLQLNGGRELAEAKVRLLVVSLGDLPGSGADPHVAADIEAARKLFAEWPTPIVAVGKSLGDQVLFPADAITGGVEWAENHPLAEAYRELGSDDAPTRELAAALYAVRPDGGYFQTTDPGTITVEDDGSLRFEASPEGPHRCLVSDPNEHERLAQTYRELALEMPPARELPEFLKRFIEREKEEAEKEEK